MEVVRRRSSSAARAGVWFRESARRRAEELGVSGWVRNHADGTVEAELEAADDVAVLVSWLGLKPPQARRLRRRRGTGPAMNRASASSSARTDRFAERTGELGQPC
jgi:acylphosphatase